MSGHVVSHRARIKWIPSAVPNTIPSNPEISGIKPQPVSKRPRHVENHARPALVPLIKVRTRRFVKEKERGAEKERERDLAIHPPLEFIFRDSYISKDVFENRKTLQLG